MIKWLIGFALLAQDPQIILGVLEEIPGHYTGQPASRGVRVVFQKNGREWQAFPSSCADEACLKTIASQFPATVTWTIAFSGRGLGRVTGTTPNAFEFYSDIGVQKITGNGPVPAVGKRPLMADSQPYFEDPDGWKPSHPPEAGLRAEFRKKFPAVSNCATSKDEAKPWAYRDADLKVGKAYSSNRRWSVVEVVLQKYRCEGPSDDAFAGQWFAVSPGGEVKFIGQGMWLLDAGDYDNDGKSEVVFAIDRYNEGGYELFYDDFKGHAVFRFSYH